MESLLHYDILSIVALVHVLVLVCVHVHDLNQIEEGGDWYFQMFVKGCMALNRVFVDWSHISVCVIHKHTTFIFHLKFLQVIN